MTPSASVGRARPAARRGVLLLVVLSLLTLFMLLGTTFLILSSRARTTSRAYLRLAADQTRTADGYGPLLRDAAMQVIRGTERSTSALRYHDLLGDRYGADGGQEFVIGMPVAENNEQILRIPLLMPQPEGTPAVAANRSGQVLTFLDSGTSVRIITSLSPAGENTSSVWVPSPPTRPAPGSRVWINDRDFAGAGLDRATANLPNWSLVTVRPNGTTNEDYDAPDAQNIALASAGRPSFSGVPFAESTPPEGIPQPLWNKICRRRTQLRPFAEDHSPDNVVDFTGRRLTEAGLDVDVDGDGTLDSVWLDLGAATFSLPDRTLIKPLFAIQCLDLGGRVNLNVHGSPAHLGGQPADRDALAASGEEPPALRPGLGFTPLDVRLDTALGRDSFQAVVSQFSPPANAAAGAPIIRRAPPMVGRYGGSTAGLPTADPAPGGLPRLRGVATRLYGGGPADFWSRRAVGVDHWGHPSFLPMAGTESFPPQAPPSAIDLFRPNACAALVGDPAGAAGLDQPYTAAELEALLRPFDYDNAAIMPPRLLAMALGSNSLEAFRELCTSESWDTPAVIGGLPSFIGNTSGSRAAFDPDLVAGLRMDLNRPFGDAQDNDGDGIVDEPTEQNWADDLERLLPNPLPQEINGQPGPDLPGLRARQLFAFHLCNLLVGLEQAQQTAAAAVERPLAALGLASGSWQRARDGDPLTLAPAEVGLRLPGGLGRHNRRALAQWAVNVVDFMDPDAIMTPFRYDGQTVWGCEAPDLIITETLALHDRGIADTAAHGRTTGGGEDEDQDNDWDQVRRPRGSLFVELRRVRGQPADTLLPQELYDKQGRLELSKQPVQGTPPVWRLALAGIRTGNERPEDEIFAAIKERPDSEWLSPTGRDGAITEQITAERFVWFVAGTPDPEAVAKPTNTYVRQGNEPLLLKKGDHLVVGPRLETPLGDATEEAEASPQAITLDVSEGEIRITGFDDDQESTAQAAICIAQLAEISAGHGPSGLNISEPLGDASYPGEDEFYDPPRDKPFNEPRLDVAGSNLLAQGTHGNVSTVFLQRLADPTRAHEPDDTKPGWNPYITVDFMPIDLHVFNGSSAEAEQVRNGEALTTPHPDLDSWHFHTRQRGLATARDGKPLGSGLAENETFSNEGVMNGTQPALTANPWLPGMPSEVDHPPGQKQASPIADAPAHFAYLLNKRGQEDDDSWPMHTLGRSNISFGGIREDGAPTTPFPWIVWNDRPFASEYELLLVPRTPPGRLLTNYRNPSKDPAGNRPTPQAETFDEYGVCPRAGHLLPFTAINDPDSDDTPSRPNADILSRLFGYVRVVSPFAGANLVLEDNAPGADRWRAPFNVLPRYREPGGINLNTMRPDTDDDSNASRLWKAILGLPPGVELDDSDPAPAWKAMVESLWDDPDRPLRAAGTAIGSDAADSGEADSREYTMLRSERNPGQNGGESSGPLFGPPADAELPAGGDQYRYEERNAWFAYAPLIRAAANTTPRSEVYAIWITMGFFEVQSVSPDWTRVTPDGQPAFLYSPYPDGYRLLREHGSQTGDIRRHRAFYIYDRSIPVGYRPGQDLNVANGILVERLVD